MTDILDRAPARRAEGLALTWRLALGGAFLTYFVGTALLYFFGPWRYPMGQGQGALVVFLIAVHAAFLAGYLRGIRGVPARVVSLGRIDTIVLVGVIAELILLFPTSAFNTGHWIPMPWNAVNNLGTAYTFSLKLRESGTPYVHYVRIIIAPLLAVSVPLGVFYWNSLGSLTKVLFAASVLGTIALYVAMGANVGAAHWMVLYPWFVVASHLAGVHRLDRIGWIKAATVLGLSAVLFAVLFSATMIQRTGSYVKAGYIGGVGAEIRRPGHGQLGQRSAIRIGADGLAAYLTQGYFAVYLSLQEPFEPCYGVGNSVFLQRQVARVTRNSRFLSCSYPERIQSKGWRATTFWATIYPWIASDVTFPGTIVIVFFIGWTAGRVWLDVLGGDNPVAVAFLGQLLVMLYYFPAHNKALHSGESALAFCTLFAAWFLTRRAAGRVV